MSCTTATILLVESDVRARSFHADNLTADGYEVMEAGTITAARRLLQARGVDAAILDLGLPDGDGLELVTYVRRGDRLLARVDPELPLILLSNRDDEVERLRGFERGCDDYVTRSVGYPELRARLASVLRRRAAGAAGARVRVGSLELDALSRQAWLEGQPIILSSKEFGLLRALATDPGRVFSREELLATVWGYRSPCRSRTVDSHASRLRRKLSRGEHRFVINAWGIGYRLVDGTPA